ncbi:hypothetical protein FDB41_15080 [Clostridium botulinum]|nr:hypothetical protein [Clostridium botulinum]NFO54832.1 hypothetical protein [Clostridium botulinum]
MINKEEILKINLNKNYEEFCSNQHNCCDCELTKNNIVEDSYDQPCRQVYKLLKIIQEVK